jgi:hypothetical protein
MFVARSRLAFRTEHTTGFAQFTELRFRSLPTGEELAYNTGQQCGLTSGLVTFSEQTPAFKGLSKQQNPDSRGLRDDLAKEFFYLGMMYAAFRTA